MTVDPDRPAMRMPFRKVLIANRGEIALRVIRTARRLGLGTVAVHSSADADALHVRAADQAVAIGDARPSESYLSIPALLDAARRSGADAVHPGYGFLSESAAFAGACREAGLAFIGPSAEAIAAMGDKAGAKRLVEAVGVPCIPGYDGADQRDAHLAERAAAIGYPVMIKASAGGGGRGMRCVLRPADFEAALRSARSEAQSAFGDSTLILERALIGARHIEVQVFADRHGGAIHLGERDCSVQRRHQKLIEEAPAPALDQGLRARLCDSALAAVRAVPYEGAGTVEFLVDRGGRHFFIEMNTRLQVEHPVTEAITDLDLVEWQFRIAAGEPLPSTQDAVRFDGHAIEVRLCAEDPARDFVPQGGVLRLWQPPGGVRVEHALHSGVEIAPFYDSMIAKVIAHGHDRESARRRLAGALESLVALGVPTNREHLLRCLANPVFAAGAATTAFLSEQAAALDALDPGADRRLIRLAALVLFVSGAGYAGGDTGAVGSHPLAHRLPLPMRLSSAGVETPVTVTRVSATAIDVSIDGMQRYEVLEQSSTALRFVVDGLQQRVTFVRDGTRLWLQHDGRAIEVEDRTRAAARRAAAAGGDGQVRASMAGRVVAVLARVGDPVEAGQPLLTLEAMKMEHVHNAPRSGVVSALHAVAGEQVAAGHVVAVIQ